MHATINAKEICDACTDETSKEEEEEDHEGIKTRSMTRKQKEE